MNTVLRNRKGVVGGLGGLQVFIGLGAVGGGLGLMLEPSGSKFGIPLELLDNSPFSTYLVPGIILLTFNGLGSLVGAAASFTRHQYAGGSAMALGAFLVAWIILQVYWIEGFHWVHALYLGLGFVEFALGWSLWKAVRRGSGKAV